ncbi:MAG TPA: bifunctional phosphopantothenoylcysteine decarboxylase/phosphopantothenate--cysteine ligase CoaBC [candidate division WOR-3 bacterium]|uniref:Coenzyme A biosynthesis bifunctional protein CoaBC n=1 Tax=candidate division WOR-3 bacterium TaxID=2052148 RepID=A0A9C9K0A7_UNCW3|nr:bifunctional phosphopantothenoylcysteine decarboxylase/phosphopantothenate--cysteine ligase CoaBC [candidate division WOR-3 bacterium]
MNIVLGITGSIAAYKALELIRLFRKEGAEVRVVLTESAQHFVTPLSCQTLSGAEVYLEQFVLTRGIKHLSLAEWGDILVIAPATANILGKASSGIGDDLLSTAVLSFTKPVLFVPAMDSGMWENPIVQKNVKILKDAGFHFLEPGVGPLASGKSGKGRFPHISFIHKKILALTAGYQGLGGRRFLISGGRTEEDIDPVRVVTNRSSGKMAKELMYAVICRGGEARGVFGGVSIPLPEGLSITRVRISAEMLAALKKDVKWCDCLIMSAAVGDYRPVSSSPKKIHDERLKISMKKNRDILKELKKYKGGGCFIGFSLEDREQLKYGRRKLHEKGLDFIVLNSSKAIADDRIDARILKKDGSVVKCTGLSKWELANKILDEYIKEFN